MYNAWHRKMTKHAKNWKTMAHEGGKNQLIKANPQVTEGRNRK